MGKPLGTNLGAPIVRNDDLDTFPTHYADLGKGGYFAVADLTARDAIPDDQRVEYMVVGVVSEGKEYRLEGGITNSDWVEKTSGGGGTSAVRYTRTMSIASNNTIEIGSHPVTGYFEWIIGLQCASSGFELDSGYRVTGTTNSTGGTWQIVSADKYTDPNQASPTYQLEMMVDGTTAYYRARLNRTL